MTPEERAEKIRQDINIAMMEENYLPQGVNLLISEQIGEAIKDARPIVLPIQEGSLLSAVLLKKAKAEAYEDAAQIADQHRCKGDCDGIAGTIRAKAEGL